MRSLGRILAPLTLLEWGGILTYFYFSGRIAAFLHPMFRPLVLVTGILLLITAACVAIFREDESAHEHEHEEGDSDDHHQHSHSHDGLSLGVFLAFLILLLPLALAAKISPDSYSANLIKNRGLVEDIRSIPGAASSFANRAKSAKSIEEAATSEQEPSLTDTAYTTPSSSRKYIGVPEQTPIPGRNADSEPTLPANDYEQRIPPSPSAFPPNEFVNEFLKPNKSGCIKAEVIDLLSAAQEPFTRKDFEGKEVELIGQLVPNNANGKAKSALSAGSFKLLRLVMVCCAADAMPVAVKIETKLPIAEAREMQWLKVTGRVHYRPRSKADSDGVDYGDQPEPVIVADSIKKISAPREKYLY
jgi:uncharacterized membrane protein YcgQ (UPF0703/DUF1980 family)